MPQSGINHAELILLLLLILVSALAILAKRLQIPYPIVMVIGGLGLGLFPRIPRVSLDPDVVFLIILPPLLFSAAFHTSWREFRRNLVSIVMLAFGLVGFTIFGVAATMGWILPGFDWRLGFVLGAVIAATDAIAATAIAKRLGLPRRITELLEAESLVNDGSGLVALRFTLAMVVTGITPSFVLGVGTLLYLIAMAVVVGLLVGVAVSWVQRRIVDAPIEITISLVTPYIAYLLAEAAHCSGVLATLACGIYIGRRSSGLLSLQARIDASAVWRTLDFVLNGVVFLLLGLQLPAILAGIEGLSRSQLIIAGVLFSGIVILLRMLWVFPGSWASFQIQRRLFRRTPPLVSPRSAFVVGWGGMRGVLALAAALSLPEKLNSGAPFPQRNTILYLTFCAILATLVLQGLSMPALIRRLGLAGIATGSEEESWARRQVIDAALQALQEIRQGEDGAESGNGQQRQIFDQLEDYYRRRLIVLENSSQLGDRPEHFRSLARKLRNVERSVAIRLRNENKIHDEVLRTLERELDLLDARDAVEDG